MLQIKSNQKFFFVMANYLKKMFLRIIKKHFNIHSTWYKRYLLDVKILSSGSRPRFHVCFRIKRVTTMSFAIRHWHGEIWQQQHHITAHMIALSKQITLDHLISNRKLKLFRACN